MVLFREFISHINFDLPLLFHVCAPVYEWPDKMRLMFAR